MIKERFKVSRGPLPSTAATATASAVTQPQARPLLPCPFLLGGGQGFNDGLEELCKIQKAWAVPDMEQRDKIRQAQKTVVKETYAAFLHRWATLPGTLSPCWPLLPPPQPGSHSPLSHKARGG